MKRILITGVNSYVGNSFAEWVTDSPNSYSITKLSLRDGAWKEKNFSEFDIILHVAGVAHRKETRKNAELYYTVNRDLTIEIAKKAKIDGVKQFIFLSSMSVYGKSKGSIHKFTPISPKSNYGKSKIEAEKFIETLNDYNFKVVILRPPMIYGDGCKGNYKRLRELALKTPVFPDINNKRSMIYIDNLSEFILLLIVKGAKGVYFPQNKENVSSSLLVKKIADIHNERVKLTKLFNIPIMLFRLNVINKVFGNLTYEKSMSNFEIKYNKYDLHTSILLTERRW